MVKTVGGGPLGIAVAMTVIPVAAAASVPFSSTRYVPCERPPRSRDRGRLSCGKIGSALLKRQLHSQRGLRALELELRGHLEFGKHNIYLHWTNESWGRCCIVYFWQLLS